MNGPCMQRLHGVLQNKQAVEEQHRLQSEKAVLIDTVKKLNREVAKLEAFKKNLLQHLQDDDEVRGKGTKWYSKSVPALQISQESWLEA